MRDASISILMDIGEGAMLIVNQRFGEYHKYLVNGHPTTTRSSASTLVLLLLLLVLARLTSHTHISYVTHLDLAMTMTHSFH